MIKFNKKYVLFLIVIWNLVFCVIMCDVIVLFLMRKNFLREFIYLKDIL